MKLVRTDQFWDLMRDPLFVRISRRHGKIGNQNFRVVVAPEDLDGFIEGKIAYIQELLFQG